MKSPIVMHTSEIKHRISVLLTVKASLEFTGRHLPKDDAAKLDALETELRNRAIY